MKKQMQEYTVFVSSLFHNVVRRLAGGSHKFKVGILSCILIVPFISSQSETANAQVLRQMEVERVVSDRIFTFQEYPDYAAIYVETTIADLSIDSNMGVVADLSSPEDGVYRIIIDPIRQSIYFRAPGYREYRMNTGALSPRQVVHLSVEPLDRSITETGDLLIRSEPSGARVTLDGIPGTFETPHSFEGILAQTYNATVEFEDHDTKQFQITIDPLRPTVRDVVLTPAFGFLNLTTRNATLFLATETEPEYRVSYTPGRELRLDIGSYEYRISRPDYEDVLGSFTIMPGQVNRLDISLSPTYGHLLVGTPDAELFLRNIEGGDERAQNYLQNQRVQIDAGTYAYRLRREFYQAATGTVTIEPGQETFLSPSLEPDFATMRVRTNVSNFSLRAIDNNAPTSERRDEINLERGVRTVEVSASGYADLRLRVRAQPGERIDTTVVLESLAAVQDRQRREQMTRGILNVTADVPDAEIFINGERRGQGEVSLSMVPDTYQIEVRHPDLGRQRSSVEVPSAGVVEEALVLRPSRGSAVALSALLPGSGHLYTNRSRGYLYLAGAAAAAGFTTWSLLEYNAAGERYDEALFSYQQAGNLQDAARYRTEVLDAFGEQSRAYDDMMLGLAVFGGVYAVQMLDILILRPRYGYRGSRQTVQAGFGPQGANLTLRF